MSKINELRRKATEAIRSRKWDQAVQLYERVCDLDKHNASYRNELGDIYLKQAEVPQALMSFQRAAELYIAVGLHNNAVAVLKKILRHDPGHQDSLWQLGDVRRQQGLDTDAVGHFLEFLEQFPSVSSGSRQGFLDRCGELLEKHGSDPQILSKVESIYVEWNLPEDQARVMLVKAALAHEADQTEMVDKYVDRARGLTDGVETLSEYLALQQILQGGDPSGAVEPDAIDLTADAESLDGLSQDITSDFSIDGFEAGTDVSGPVTGEIDLGFDLEEEDAAPTPPAADPASAPSAPAAPAPAPAETAPSGATPSASVDPAPVEAQGPASGTVNLLDEILSDSDFDISSAEKQQVESIASDVHGQIAAQVEDDDHQGQYDVGVIYVEMGLFDQAIGAFEKAAHNDDLKLQALEMKGSCLQKLSRFDEALECFQEGLGIPGYPARIYQGLLFEVGHCLESLQRVPEAIDYYERVAQVDAAFPGIQDSLARARQLQT